jgi:hypothetical protein
MGRKKKNKKRGPKIATPRPEEAAFLRRWAGVKSAPTLFEKIDKNPVYEATLKSRTSIDEFGKTSEPNMGNQWGIGKPKAPN